MAGKRPDQFVAVARIARPQGRRGEVIADNLTDFPERFQQGREAFLENPGHAPDLVRVEKVWPHKGRVVLKLSGVDSIEQAEQLRGLHLLIQQADRAVLPPAHYWVGDLKGCRVVQQQAGIQKEIGTVTEVESTGGVDLLHVSRADPPGGTVLIPLAQAICTRIDPEEKTIVIDPPEGLLDL